VVIQNFWHHSRHPDEVLQTRRSVAQP